MSKEIKIESLEPEQIEKLEKQGICPNCGERELILYCESDVEYSVEYQNNDGYWEPIEQAIPTTISYYYCDHCNIRLIYDEDSGKCLNGYVIDTLWETENEQQ